MPIILRAETDMFVFQDVIDAYINPVNLVGAPGAGLALEFRKRAPEYVEQYRAACRSKELRIGTIKILENLQSPYDIWCLPTKRHYEDTSSKEDLIRGLEALRETLKSDRYRYTSVGLPMLGCGLGKQDYEVVFPLMMDHLGDLDATIFLSMSPARTELRPKYLVIVGPPSYGLTGEDKQVIDETIDKIMAHWGSDLKDYTGIVSSGYVGCDSYIAGPAFHHDVENTFTWKRTGKEPLVVAENKRRNGVGAIIKHAHLLCEIGQDFIFFKPKGHNNNRASTMQMWIENDREKRFNDGHPARRVAVFGEKQPSIVQDRMIIDIKEGTHWDDVEQDPL